MKMAFGSFERNGARGHPEKVRGIPEHKHDWACHGLWQEATRGTRQPANLAGTEAVFDSQKMSPA
jgi:hypothetical protein